MPSATSLLSACSLFVVALSGSQQPLHVGNSDAQDLYYQFPNEVHRVAVIGAGPTGLLFTSTFVQHGFEVRMFEKAPNPGGVWQYTDKIPILPTFPNRPIEIMAYVPDIPDKLPSTRVYQDGDEGLTVDWRIREHWSPSPVWKDMKTTAPHQLMRMPDTYYPKNAQWKLHQMEVSRHIRQYASSVGLNANDEEHANVTSYWTRVERAEKLPGTKRRWTVTLRKLTPLRDGRLEVNWWQEEFDAVVVGNTAQNDAAWVPPVLGLKEWAEALPSKVFHSRQYRRLDRFINKDVLIVGGSWSGIGIANELIGHARSVSVSTHKTTSNPLIAAISSMFHQNVTHLPEVVRFGHLPSMGSLREASLTLANGTVASGFDAIILATGYRRSLPYLAEFHNSTIKGRNEPETTIAPLITDGTHIRSLHWTGHYIPDPTLLFATEGPWQDGSGIHQAVGAARVWSKKARLPSIARMWKYYPGAAKLVYELPIIGQTKNRLFATWLNNEILEFGGSFLPPQDVDEFLELFRYYTAKEYPEAISDFYRQSPPAERPRREWDVYNSDDEDHLRPRSHFELKRMYGDAPPEHWADLTLRW